MVCNVFSEWAIVAGLIIGCAWFAGIICGIALCRWALKDD